MAQQSLDVDVLTGQARNPTYAQNTRGTVPEMVLNLVPDQEGGLSPYGRRVRLQKDESNVNIPEPVALVGYDETGVSSFVEDEAGEAM